MFKNPGKKIKTMAIVSFWIVFIGSVIAGIILIADGWPEIGLPLLFGGFFVAYAENLLLYGFGELIENSSASNPEEDSKDIPAIVTKVSQNTPPAKPAAPVAPTAPTNKKTQPPVQSNSAPKKDVVQPVISQENSNIIECPKCGFKQQVGRTVCWHCGVKFQ